VTGAQLAARGEVAGKVADSSQRTAPHVTIRGLSGIKFGYVFQNYREAMFPWLRAFDSILYPLKVTAVPKFGRTARVEKLVANLNVKIDLSLYPYQMSGG
jgi:NitT/TauT family transport system ATP-binding protein